MSELKLLLLYPAQRTSIPRLDKSFSARQNPSKFVKSIQSSHIALVCQSVCSRTIADRLYSDSIAEFF